MSQKKSSIIYVRCTPELKEEITERAARAGTSLSNYMCRLATDSSNSQHEDLLPIEFWKVPRSIQDISDKLDRIFWEMQRSGRIDRKLKKILLEESRKFEEVRREILKKYVLKQ